MLFGAIVLGGYCNGGNLGQCLGMSLAEVFVGKLIGSSLAHYIMGRLSVSL